MVPFWPVPLVPIPVVPVIPVMPVEPVMPFMPCWVCELSCATPTKLFWFVFVLAPTKELFEF